MPTTAHPALAGLHVLERGWLSSNNLLVPDPDGALLVDTGHVTHAAQTVALVGALLDGRRLARIVNTHLHSDHCGGNASLQRAFGAIVSVPAGSLAAVRDWDADALSHATTGQLCEPFDAAGAIVAGDTVAAGDARFEVIEAPGHDPRSMILFDRHRGLLLSADALWENGFGVVFPELDGEPGFDDVARVLDLIGHLPVRLVVPGHGAPFTDVDGALARARSRLGAFVAEPRRHARHGAKVLVKFHLMEVLREPRADFAQWAARTPLIRRVWDAHGRHESDDVVPWALALADELAVSGALRSSPDELANA